MDCHVDWLRYADGARQDEKNMPRPFFLIAPFLLAVPLGAAAAQSPLATAQQAAFDRESLRIFASPVVQDQIGSVVQAFSSDPYFATAEGKRTLPDAAREIVFAAVVDSINRDPARPGLQWVWAPSHRWFGVTVPASKVLMPNVDNVFRIVPVDNVSHYRIGAAPAGPVPTQFSVQLLPALPGESHWSKVIQELVDSDIRKAPDGSFALTIGPEQNGGANHIATTPGSHFLLIRDTIQDWHRETPYRLTITRLDGPPPGPVADEAELARQAAARVREITPRILQAKGGGFGNIPGFFQGPANQLTVPKIREGGRWGFSSSGHFLIADDEALAITLDPMGAGYLSVQLASGWLSSLDYLHHAATLNLAQSKRNPDGTLTFLIAAHDPGVANWLDTDGLHEGSIFVRWQKLPTGFAGGALAIRSVRVVKIGGGVRGGPLGVQRVVDYERRSAER
jgi:hypothetical protein